MKGNKWYSLVGLSIVGLSMLSIPYLYAQPEKESPLVDLDVRDADIREVVQILSEASGINILVHEEVKTKVTMHLRQRPLDTILRAIVKMYGLSLEEEEGIYYLKPGGEGSTAGSPVVRQRVTRPALFEEPEVVLQPVTPPAPAEGADLTTLPSPPSSTQRPPRRVRAPQTAPRTHRPRYEVQKIDLIYAKPSELARQLGGVGIEPGMSLPPELAQRFAPFLRGLGGPSGQYPPAYQQQFLDALRNFGGFPDVRDQIGFGGLGGFGGGLGGLGGYGGYGGYGGLGGLGGYGGFGGFGGGIFGMLLPPEVWEGLAGPPIGFDLLNALIVVGTPDAIEALREIVALLDVAPKQIEIEARFVTIRVQDEERLGITWALSNGQTSISSLTAVPGDVGVRYAIGNFNAELQTLINEQKARVINAPTVATQNGQPATLTIGTEVPFFPSVVQTTQFGTTVQVGAPSTITVGTSLFVVPRITGTPPNESITVLVVPIVQDIAGTATSPDGQQVPISNTQQIFTTLRVRDGETIALGGLIRKDEDENIHKVPLLADLPIIGRLFQSRTTRATDSELIIFITPRIIREEMVGPATAPALAP